MLTREMSSSCGLCPDNFGYKGALLIRLRSFKTYCSSQTLHLEFSPQIAESLSAIGNSVPATRRLPKPATYKLWKSSRVLKKSIPVGFQGCAQKSTRG